MKTEYQTIYKDEDIIVVNKPAGLLTIPDRYNKSLPCLSAMLRKDFEDVFVVHRLDKDTSGLVVFAFNAESHRHLNMQFDAQKVTKIYHAVVKGVVFKDEIDIDIPIQPDSRTVGKMQASIRGKESLTKVRVIERYRNATLVECNLVTGRQHQLRVHVMSIGHPLLVDDLYGTASNFCLSEIKRKFNLKKNTDELPIIARQTMHAYSLEFTHPTTTKMVKFEAPYPKDFSVLVKLLDKYSRSK